MEFTFVKTKELKEFEKQIKDSIKIIKHNALKLILYTFIFYFVLCSLIIAL